MQNDFITRAQAQEILKCSVSTLWRLCKAGKIKKFQRSSKLNLYSRSDINAFIQSTKAAIS